jgi:hypothetical protein
VYPFLNTTTKMRLSLLTVAIVACLLTLVAAWSKEGKFSPQYASWCPTPITNSKPQTRKSSVCEMKSKPQKGLASHSTTSWESNQAQIRMI